MSGGEGLRADLRPDAWAAAYRVACVIESLAEAVADERADTSFDPPPSSMLHWRDALAEALEDFARASRPAGERATREHGG